MNIAVLNFPLDNNYGGNLQRFALIHILQNLGHKPTHLYTKFYFPKVSIIKIIKRFFSALLRFKIPSNLNPEKKAKQQYEKELKNILPFYNKYIPHTNLIDSPQKLFSYQDFDAFLVGSDQVWRRSMSYKYPFESMFFNWVHNTKSLKIAYGISFGINHHEIPDTELHELSCLYKKFKAVSVRETSAIDILTSLNWTNPKAELVLDPTLLIDKRDYLKIIDDATTEQSNGDLFCYILDSNESSKIAIQKKASEKHLTPFFQSLTPKTACSIEQWLKSFVDAQYVITDSFHGCIFSIIFNKPFMLIKNERRGMTRFESLFKLLGINESHQDFDWKSINSKLDELKKNSISFIRRALTTTT